MSVLIHGMTVRPKNEEARQAAPIYRTYHAMKSRCLNENHSRYQDYGGRGITICDRWLSGEEELTGFECFIKDMGPRPSENHTIGRKDNNGDYCLDNCSWETDQEQRRNTSQTIWINIYDERISLIEAVEKYGKASYPTIRKRICSGWEVERALLTPVKIV